MSRRAWAAIRPSSGYFFSTGAGSSMASDNTRALVESGVLRAPNELIKIWETYTSG